MKDLEACPLQLVNPENCCYRGMWVEREMEEKIEINSKSLCFGPNQLMSHQILPSFFSATLNILIEYY